MRSFPVLSLSLLLATICSCGDDGGSGAVVDAGIHDSAVADADTRPDAFDPCPGQAYFAGEYIDWDSSLQNFRGVALAEISQRDEPANTDQTSPNGRWEICVDVAVDVDFDGSESEYLAVIISMDADGHSMAPLTVRGLKPARLATLFADELSKGGPEVTVDPEAAQVQVDLRRPNGDPVLGATVALGASHAGAFTFDDSHLMQKGATTSDNTDDGTVFFANVSVGGGSTSVTITPPQGLSCVGPEKIPVAKATMSVVSFACD